VRDLFANEAAAYAGQRGRPLPSGSVLAMEVYQAKLDDKGEPVKGADGRFVKGALVGLFVMEKRTGWGAEHPESLRNGEWEYARFGADGARPQADTRPCLECHKPESAKDYVFTLDKLHFRGK
jgi:hemoglobin